MQEFGILSIAALILDYPNGGEIPKNVEYKKCSLRGHDYRHSRNATFLFQFIWIPIAVNGCELRWIANIYTRFESETV